MRKKLVAMTLALMLGATAVTGCTTTTTEEAGEAPAAESTESGEAAEGGGIHLFKEDLERG